LLSKLTQKRFRKIIYASSSVLYGDQSNSPRKENDPLFVYDSYTRVKHLSEHLVTANKGTILRFSNLYGKGMSDKNVMSSILNQVKDPGPIALRSTSPVRDFLWVEDAAKAILQTIQNDLTGIYNVGSGVGTSIGQLADLFVQNIGQNNRQINSQDEKKITSHLVLDISKIVQTTDWYPQMSLKQGIARLLYN
jgi:nucleoside-diphosphate-sugar epimerase